MKNLIAAACMVLAVPAAAATLGNPAPAPAVPMSSGRFDYQMERTPPGAHAATSGQPAAPVCTKERGVSTSTIPSVTAPGCGPGKGGAYVGPAPPSR